MYQRPLPYRKVEELRSRFVPNSFAASGWPGVNFGSRWPDSHFDQFNQSFLRPRVLLNNVRTAFRLLVKIYD